MKHFCKIKFVFSILLIFVVHVVFSQQEEALWPNGIPNNPINYQEEKVRTNDVTESSPSQQNRVFSQVSEPTFTLFQAKPEIANGVAVVICPGGGFRDVWFDREGVDTSHKKKSHIAVTP